MQTDQTEPPKRPEYAATPFPKNARMFFCIGAQKAGTTWLYDYLSGHQDCHFSPNKELHYFDVMAGRADTAVQLRIDVLKQFAEELSIAPGKANRANLTRVRNMAELLEIYTGEGAPAQRNRHAPYLNYLQKGYADQPVLCDITPAYAILNRNDFADMASIGRAKFLFIMRDPIQRMWSQIRMAVKTANTPKDKFDSACYDHALLLANQNRLKRIERANYRHTITELEAAASLDRIKYVFYEDLFNQKAANEICDFLEIARHPAATNRVVNIGHSAEIPAKVQRLFKRAFAQQYEFIRDKFGDAVPLEWHNVGK